VYFSYADDRLEIKHTKQLIFYFFPLE